MVDIQLSDVEVSEVTHQRPIIFGVRHASPVLHLKLESQLDIVRVVASAKGHRTVDVHRDLVVLCYAIAGLNNAGHCKDAIHTQRFNTVDQTLSETDVIHVVVVAGSAERPIQIVIVFNILAQQRVEVGILSLELNKGIVVPGVQHPNIAQVHEVGRVAVDSHAVNRSFGVLESGSLVGDELTQVAVGEDIVPQVGVARFALIARIVGLNAVVHIGDQRGAFGI